ncbi:1-(5-phosphoribosyl)-5-((5-phosphoribosylamino)methylideneamino)imidazole-4-carboxamide isomerase [Acidianus brierleyi]|uniref:1-(5-phosphoribosyl)-5-((5-phosphoribosylamino)methylideneamino)imidazole-4-carboxamide isomerase n=1 Tax=Acidianus brierleyi TaxID=41673 RepID=A0A2U9IFG5_9CREN|nr:1-(5-phosphoribosyl)-5-((5-phosphoribosylamino)methylideneamino)imidazole-4-carboxamide isomerase [Acidianus brierleyi]AWR94792.1 1-(5-phosphoribosyl)-5-((5-phosphoribosylamino)methylideneamino)imidazole-4-carboxamide isomerase [Acidianus brierleyi]
MIVVPSIDISEGKVVKRIRGKRGSGLILGNPLDIAYRIYSDGYNYVHIVDLDAAEGVGSNEDIIRNIVKIGFDNVEVGGGIRDLNKAKRLISYGISFLVVSTIIFTDKTLFDQIIKEVGRDKIISSLDYCNNIIYIKGWKEKSISLNEGIDTIKDTYGTIFTNICNEGTKSGIDKTLGKYILDLHNMKGYAGGIGNIKDLTDLKELGFDFAIVGMSFYSGILRGIKYV